MSADAFNSPFIVPVGAFVMVLGIFIANKVSEVKKRQLEFQERMQAIAKGLPLPPLESEAKYAWLEQMNGGNGQTTQLRVSKPAGGVRRGGLVLVAAGVGLALFFITLSIILRERDVLAGAASALIPFAIGVGLLIDARMSAKEFEEAKASATTEAALRQ